MSALAELSRRFSARPKRGRVGCIGLHFSEEKLHAIQLRRLQSGAFCLRSWASVAYEKTREDALDSPKQLRRLVQILMKRSNFRGRKVITALPPGQLRITSLNYQSDGRMSDPERILRLMSDRLPGDIGDYVVDYLPVRGDPGDNDKVALVTASRQEDVTRFLEVLHAVGLEVAELEVGPAALNRLVGILPREAGITGNVLIVNYGVESTYLTIISRRRLLLDKEIKFGSRTLIECIATALDIDAEHAGQIALREGLTPGASTGIDEINPVAEILKPAFSRLVEEVRRVCLYAASESQGESIDQVYTFGSIARWAGADEMLARMAKIPVADVLPLTAIFDAANSSGAGDWSGIGPELAVATGLALRGLAVDE